MNSGITSSYLTPRPPAATITRPPESDAQPANKHSARLPHHAIKPTTPNPQLNGFSKHCELHRLNQLSDADFSASIRSLIDANRVDLLEQIPKSWFFAKNQADLPGQAPKSWFFGFFANNHHHREHGSERVCYGDFTHQDRRDTLLHYAIEQRQYASLWVLVKKLPELISQENRLSLTAVQLAAAKGDVHSIQIITSQDEHCLKQRNIASYTALGCAIKEGQLDTIRYIVRKWPETTTHSTTDPNHRWGIYSSLFPLASSKKINRHILQFFLENRPGLFNSTLRIFELLCSMVASNNEDCIRWLFTLETTQRMLLSLDSYQYFADLSVGMPTLFRQLQAPGLLPPQPIKGLDVAAYRAELHRLATRYHPTRHSASDVTEALDLDTQNTGIHYLHAVRAFLTGIGCTGIHLEITMYSNEAPTNKTYTSLGDLSASVQMMDGLIDLGAKNISLFVAITSECNRFESDPDILAFGMNKLGLLLSANEPLAHDLSIDRRGCKVKIILLNKLPAKDSAAREAQEELPAVMLSFSIVTEQFTNINTLYDTDNTSFITIRPYGFYKGSEYLLTDINTQRDRANSIPLHLPQHSVIQLSAGSLPEHDANTTTCKDKQQSSFARQAADKMCTMVSSQQVHISVVYGVHCAKSGAAALTRWVKAIQLQLKTRHDRPMIIAVFPNNSKKVISALNYLNTDVNIPLLDLAQEDAINQLNQLIAGDLLIAKMPSLPRTTFNKLINSSDYPSLSEGANLTSFLLQTGHPYLSVLPAGNTPVPQNIGDPLEAMKANALSYKLHIADNDADRGKLEKLWQKIQAENFEDALTMVEEIRKSDNRNLTFLWGVPASKSGPGRAPLVTVATLLKKFKTLKEDGKAPARPAIDALKAAVDATLNCYVDFLNNCQNHQSTTVNHTQLMQQHTCLPVNSSICLAITKLLQHKGVPCRFT